MLTIAKGIVDGAWDLIVGWVLPCAISLVLFRALVFPALGGESIQFGSMGEDGALLLLALVFGWTLSAISTPLYRVLEGYLLWPAPIRRVRKEHHLEIRRRLKEKADRTTPGSLGCSLAYEELYRYPLSDEQVMPTRLGNAIRSFECYGQDRYRLDVVRMWPHLLSCVAEGLRREVNQARAGVDFFVSLTYTAAVVAIVAVGTMIVQRDRFLQLSSAAAIGGGVAVLSSRAAISATDTWAASVRAIVDLGRLPLATAYGLRLPSSLVDERRMWEYLGWAMAFPYTPESAKRMDEFRIGNGQEDSGDGRPVRAPKVSATASWSAPAADPARRPTRRLPGRDEGLPGR